MEIEPGRRDLKDSSQLNLSKNSLKRPGASSVYRTVFEMFL